MTQEVDFNHAFNRILQIQEAKKARLEALAQGWKFPTGRKRGPTKTVYSRLEHSGKQGGIKARSILGLRVKRYGG